MDAATFTAHTACNHGALGVNRASVGAQSFDDHLLAACRCVHLAVDALPEARFENISLNSISGLLGLAMETWRASLPQALRLDSDHVSKYDLTVKESTNLGNKNCQGEAAALREPRRADGDRRCWRVGGREIWTLGG